MFSLAKLLALALPLFLALQAPVVSAQPRCSDDHLFIFKAMLDGKMQRFSCSSLSSQRLNNKFCPQTIDGDRINQKCRKICDNCRGDIPGDDDDCDGVPDRDDPFFKFDAFFQGRWRQFSCSSLVTPALNGRYCPRTIDGVQIKRKCPVNCEFCQSVVEQW